MTARAHGSLSATWWVVCPIFAAVVTAATADRVCAGAETLADLMDHRGTAWLAAAAYLVGWTWTLVAYVTTARRSDALVPSTAAVRSIWGRAWPQPVVMTVLVAIDFAPQAVWRGLGSVLC